jgi:feruloyl esterase
MKHDESDIRGNRSLLFRRIGFPLLLTLYALSPLRALEAIDPGNPWQNLRDVKTENGKILSVEFITSPTLVLNNNQTVNNLPPRTVVKWTMSPAEGSNINAEMWLPEPSSWNERFVGLGNGGAAGAIHPGGLIRFVRQNFAVATTDLGTSPNADSGIDNPEVWKDFGFRATHLMTASAKKIAGAYYGRDAKFSYFLGRSTGGQQAMQEAQRYPEDYDGIVAEVPAHCRTPLHAYFLWNDQIMRACQFSAAQEANIMAAGVEYMASREGPHSAGKFVSDPRHTEADIAAVVKLAMQKDPPLTASQAEGLRKIFEGPRHSVTGEFIFGGVPFGSSLAAAHGHLYLFKWVFGRNKDLATIDFGADFDAYTKALAPFLNAENPDLDAFARRGGIILMITGTADSVVPYHATIDYYERLVEASGSLEAAQSFARLFVIPGMDHNGGPGITSLPDPLSLVMKWREEGLAPDRLEGKRVVNGKLVLEMPLFPYPTRAVWSEETQAYLPVSGPRGGVGQIATQFRGVPAQ